MQIIKIILPQTSYNENNQPLVVEAAIEGATTIGLSMHCLISIHWLDSMLGLKTIQQMTKRD